MLTQEWNNVLHSTRQSLHVIIWCIYLRRYSISLNSSHFVDVISYVVKVKKKWSIKNSSTIVNKFCNCDLLFETI